MLTLFLFFPALPFGLEPDELVIVVWTKSLLPLRLLSTFYNSVNGTSSCASDSPQLNAKNKSEKKNATRYQFESTKMKMSLIELTNELQNVEIVVNS